VVRVRPAADPRAERCVAPAVDGGGGAAAGNGLVLRRPFYSEGKAMAFDTVLSADASQAAVFEAVAARVMADVLAGYNGTVLCYGQTGSGKPVTTY